MILLSALFALVFLAAVSVIYTTTRLGIPPMPSNSPLRNAVLEVVREAGSAERIVDLGAGWGGLARALALTYPQRRVEGVELSWVPFLVAKLGALLLGPANFHVRQGDFGRERLDSDTIYVCYISPAGMERLAEAIDRSGAERVRVVSAAFALPNRQPEGGVVAGDLMQSPVYYYVARGEVATGG